MLRSRSSSGSIPRRVGDDVHLRFDGEVRLRSRRRAERAEVRLVGVDREALEQQVRDPVRAGQHQRGHRGHARPRAREGAGVEPETALARQDPAVAADPGLQLDDRRLPRIRGRQLVLARGHDLHGASGLAGQQRGEVLDADAELAAEAAADARHDDAHARGRQLQDLGQRALDLEGQLGVGPHGDLARAVPLRDGGPGLGVPLVHAPRGEAVLEDAIGLLEPPLDVTDDDAGAIADVALAMQDRQRRVAGPALVHERRAGRQRRRHIGHRGQRLAHHVDRGQRRGDGVQRHGGDGGQRLAGEADAVAREHFLVLHAAAVPHVGRIGGGDDRAHAGQPSRAARIDAQQASVRLPAAQHAAVQHAGQREVGGVDGRAGHLARGIHAGQRVPDHAGHRAARAALSTASAIFW